MSDELEQLKTEIKRLESLVYVNGLFKCAKCGFVMSCRNLNMNAGMITSNNAPQQCNNGCGPMWRVAAKDDREEIIESVEGIIMPLRAERDAALARAEVMEHNWDMEKLRHAEVCSELFAAQDVIEMLLDEFGGYVCPAIDAGITAMQAAGKDRWSMAYQMHAAEAMKDAGK